MYYLPSHGGKDKFITLCWQPYTFLCCFQAGHDQLLYFSLRIIQLDLLIMNTLRDTTSCMTNLSNILFFQISSLRAIMKRMDKFGGIWNHRRKWAQGRNLSWNVACKQKYRLRSTWCELGTRGAGGPPMASRLCWTSALCLIWKQVRGPSEPWEFSAGTTSSNYPTHPVASSYCLTQENSPPRQILTQPSVWALAWHRG